MIMMVTVADGASSSIGAEQLLATILLMAPNVKAELLQVGREILLQMVSKLATNKLHGAS